MKLIFEEHGPVDYSHYAFPYCVYCIREDGDSYSEIYEKGFLPYTNNLSQTEPVFYLARSVRVPLSEHVFKSKQKNILNKIGKVYSDDTIRFELIEKEKLMHDSSFRKWCIRNAKDGFLHKERLDYILSRPYLVDILRVGYEGKTLSYIFPVHEARDCFHYWYSFYDLNVDLNDFGKWVFMKTIEWAQNQGYVNFYLGTCYSKSAFYKLSLSPATYYSDGTNWQSDIDSLKKRLLTEVK